MRITRETRDELVLDHAPWGLALAMIGIVLAGAMAGIGMVMAGLVVIGLLLGAIGVFSGLAGLVLFVERCQVWLDRPQGTLTARRRTPFGMTQTQLPLSGVDYALLQSKSGPQGAVGRRAAIMTAAGRQIVLTETYIGGPGPERVVAAINRWLAAKA